MLRLILLIFCFCLCACNDVSDNKPESVDQSGLDTANSDSALESERAPTPEKVVKADKMIAYSNQAHEFLESGSYKLADIFHANSQNYLHTFRLPARPKITRKAAPRPDNGVFDEAEANLVAKGLAGMDKAMDNLLGNYANLEKYIADKSIRDDGKQGEELVTKISKAHADFIAARDTWLDIVQKRAAEAEQVLLYQHPLKRQIMAGSAIFRRFEEVAQLLAAKDANPDLINACRQNIERLVREGAKPPFPAKPVLERLYRAFLKTVDAYLVQLDSGLMGGFYKPQISALNSASQACTRAWNEFVKTANGQPS